MFQQMFLRDVIVDLVEILVHKIRFAPQCAYKRRLKLLQVFSIISLYRPVS